MDLQNYIPFLLIPFIAWGVRRFLIEHGRYDRHTKITFIIGITAYFLTEMARSFYRPYIYANDIYDWHIADTIGNSLGTVTAIFMILTMAGRGTNWDWRLILIVIAGLLGYELLNLVSDRPFDFNDALATLIFGALSGLTYAILLRKNPRPEANGLNQSGQARSES